MILTAVGITVHNNFTDNHNGTAIHWHGIRQVNTNWLDGVPGVTQCPSKVRKNKLMKRGTALKIAAG
jgi:FtsP/CotA-like multicopper oxidase with cupredoxin domain